MIIYCISLLLILASTLAGMMLLGYAVMWLFTRFEDFCHGKKKK